MSTSALALSWAHWRSRLQCILSSLIGVTGVYLTGCSGGDATPPPVAIASIEIAPESSDVLIGGTVQLSATVRDAQGATISGRPISWATSNSAVASVSNAGLVTSVGGGRAVITATAEARSASAVVHVLLPFDTLPGLPTAPAVSAVRLQEVVVGPENYSTDHPQLGTLPVSFNTVVISIAADATIAQVNALFRATGAKILGGVPGIPGQHAAVLVLRLATRSHAELAPFLATLMAAPIIRAAAPDVLLGPEIVTASSSTTPAQWVWERPANGGNWGLEVTRAPQMWNINELVRHSGSRTETGIFDDGFANHTDLRYVAVLGGLSGLVHGTHVAGTIAAIFDNGDGVEGMNPFADLVIKSAASLATLTTGLAHIISTRPGMRVINLSLAYNWLKQGVNIATNSSAQSTANAQGRVVWDMLAATAASGRTLPVIVAASGNDGYSGVAQTQLSSPFTNAALRLGAAPFVIVEAVRLAGGTVSRPSFSNLGGHVAAPGEEIMSTMPGNAYALRSGTSMAAPHVTGLVSFLYSLDPLLAQPTMLANPIRDLLVANSSAAGGGAARMIDAFASAMDLDRLRGGDRVLRGLLDIDDGTLDGNQRVSAGTDFTAEDADGDSRRGDGKIDVSDFRRWRDWLLQAENPPGVKLDGSANHPKKDLNGDKLVKSPNEENIYPRGDFNGDGMISRTDAVPVRGAMGNQQATDLEVLQHLFSDPDYTASALPELVYSGDIEVDPTRCFTFGPKRIVSTVRELDTQLTRRIKTHADTAPRFIHTLPVHPAGYKAKIEFYDQADTVVWHQEKDTTLAMGEDIRVECDLLYFNDFQAAIGPEWSFNSTSTSPSGQRFLGELSNHSVSLSLTALPTHSELALEFDLYIIASWNGNAELPVAGLPDIIEISVAGGPMLKRTTFSNKPRDRQAFPGDFPGASHPAGTGALSLNSLGYPPGPDFFGDAVYRLRLPFPHSSPDITLQLNGNHSGQIERWGIDNVRLVRVR